MGLIAPAIYIDPPSVEPHRFGLYSVAITPDAVGRWENGVEYEPIAGERASLRTYDCVDEYTGEVDLRDGESLEESIPFIVVGSYSCKSASRPIAEAEERARLHLAAGEERAVELAVSTGQMGNSPAFTDASDITPVAGTGVSTRRAVGLLEEAVYGDSGSLGAIYGPRFAGAILNETGSIMRAQQHLETMLGTYASFGAYANEGPEGEDAGDGFWLYATSTRPTIRRGEVFVQPDETKYLNRENNDVAVMAQRTILVSWTGLTYAILVDPAED